MRRAARTPCQRANRIPFSVGAGAAISSEGRLAAKPTAITQHSLAVEERVTSISFLGQQDVCELLLGAFSRCSAPLLSALRRYDSPRDVTMAETQSLNALHCLVELLSHWQR